MGRQASLTTSITNHTLLPARAALGFFVAIASVLFIAALSYFSASNYADSRLRMSHTLQVLQGLDTLLSGLKDAETGQRGLLLTGEDRYLEPYTRAKVDLPTQLESLRKLLDRDAPQTRQLEQLDKTVIQKMDELALTIDLHRQKNDAAALKVVLSDEGRTAMDSIRRLIAEMKAAEERTLAARQDDVQRASNIANVVTWLSAVVLLSLIGLGIVLTARAHQASEREKWLLAGEAGLTSEILGDLPLEELGRRALLFISRYLNAQAGSFFMAQGGHFRRIAAHALDKASARTIVESGEGLLGQAALDHRALHVRAVPADYFVLASSLGQATATELLIAPASVDGEIHGAVELGFFHAVGSLEQALLARVTPLLALALRRAKDRSRLEELLEETQRQSEELQQQQEELRVSNEELEEQGRALKESQTRLESQHAELEQINTMLEEQTQQLEGQRNDLENAQRASETKSAELARSNQYKSEFLANMSHELRTPLNSSLIFAKLLADNKQGNLSDEQVRFAQAILAGGEDLLALINDILDLSAIEARKMELNPEPLLVAPMLESMLKLFRPIAEQKGLQLVLAVDPAAPPRIESDSRRLGQIVKNLVSNALKFTQQGEVRLEVKQVGSDQIAFSVRDTGIGISPESQELVFEAFRQGDGSTNRKYGGTGLGLSIARELAQLLGGAVGLQSEPGKGSTFTLTLPVAFTAGPTTQLTAGASSLAPTRQAVLPDPAAAPIASAGKLEAIALKDDRDALSDQKRRILVIEDDEAFASILLDLARERGFQCLVTHTASQGLLAALQYRPHAILLDLNLPDHFGLALLDQLKRNPATRHIPVHIASVADHTREALEIGAVGFGVKPVRRENLVAAFEKLEATMEKGLRRVLVVEDDPRQRESLIHLLGSKGTEIVPAATAAEALQLLGGSTFDCVVIDLNLPDLSGYELLKTMAQREDVAFPPVIVYTGRQLSREEEQDLRRYSRTIIIKDARSPERLLDEVTLFLHQVESTLPAESQRLLRVARHRDAALDGRCLLVVEDDVRNVFALTSLLEPKGAKIVIARNGREALEALSTSGDGGKPQIDLVLMDIMMPEMDGLTAMREIRQQPKWKKLPIIALTAKVMPDDQQKALNAGASDYIAKPLDTDKLLSLIRVWMPKPS